MSTHSSILQTIALPQAPQRLRPAVLAQAAALPSSSRQAIMALSGPRPLRFCLELGSTWLIIAALVALGALADSVLVTALCVVLIGTRQMVLALLLHEQVHRLGMRGKYADWIINVLAVYPLFVTTVEDYAKVHLAHHKYCFTKDDPDFVRKSGQEWRFPTSRSRLLKIVAHDLFGMNLLRVIRGKTAQKTAEFTRRNPSPGALRWVFFLGLALGLSMAGGWTLFLVYWVLPALTVTQVLLRWIAIAEHEYNVPDGALHETTPLIKLSWWQRWLVPDLHFGLHVYHHMHPGVSFANLPKVHAIYADAGLVDDSAIFHGQFAYLQYLVSGD